MRFFIDPGRRIKITKVRAAAHQRHNVMTGWRISLDSHDSHELRFVRIDTDDLSDSAMKKIMGENARPQ